VLRFGGRADAIAHTRIRMRLAARVSSHASGDVKQAGDLMVT
jgi:hypothetical protein